MTVEPHDNVFRLLRIKRDRFRFFHGKQNREIFRDFRRHLFHLRPALLERFTHERRTAIFDRFVHPPEIEPAIENEPIRAAGNRHPRHRAHFVIGRGAETFLLFPLFIRRPVENLRDLPVGLKMEGRGVGPEAVTGGDRSGIGRDRIGVGPNHVECRNIAANIVNLIENHPRRTAGVEFFHKITPRGQFVEHRKRQFIVNIPRKNRRMVLVFRDHLRGPLDSLLGGVDGEIREIILHAENHADIFLLAEVEHLTIRRIIRHEAVEGRIGVNCEFVRLHRAEIAAERKERLAVHNRPTVRVDVRFEFRELFHTGKGAAKRRFRAVLRMPRRKGRRILTRGEGIGRNDKFQIILTRAARRDFDRLGERFARDHERIGQRREVGFECTLTHTDPNG